MGKRESERTMGRWTRVDGLPGQDDVKTEAFNAIAIYCCVSTKIDLKLSVNGTAKALNGWSTLRATFKKDRYIKARLQPRPSDVDYEAIVSIGMEVGGLPSTG